MWYGRCLNERITVAEGCIANDDARDYFNGTLLPRVRPLSLAKCACFVTSCDGRSLIRTRAQFPQRRRKKLLLRVSTICGTTLVLFKSISVRIISRQRASFPVTISFHFPFPFRCSSIHTFL